jgi:glycerol-3-phosphate dehydrogenase
MPGAARAAALESRTWTSAAIGASTTAVRTTAASTITSATLRPLEARARIAADAGGIAREVFARSAGTADARGASLSWQEDHVVLENRGLRGVCGG